MIKSFQMARNFERHMKQFRETFGGFKMGRKERRRYETLGMKLLMLHIECGQSIDDVEQMVLSPFGPSLEKQTVKCLSRDAVPGHPKPACFTMSADFHGDVPGLK